MLSLEGAGESPHETPARLDVLLHRERSEMPAGLTTLSLMASALYSLVLLACLAAAVTGRRLRQAPAHWQVWLVLAALFGVFAVLRISGAEEWVKDTLRASLRAGGEYRERRNFQAPLVAAILAIAGAGSLALLYRMTRNLRGRRNVALLAARLAAIAMLALIALRLASLHATDALLYGPVKLNWVVDFGSSVVAMLAAIAYIRAVRARP